MAAGPSSEAPRPGFEQRLALGRHRRTSINSEREFAHASALQPRRTAGLVRLHRSEGDFGERQEWAGSDGRSFMPGVRPAAPLHDRSEPRVTNAAQCANVRFVLSGIRPKRNGVGDRTALRNRCGQSENSKTSVTRSPQKKASLGFPTPNLKSSSPAFRKHILKFWEPSHSAKISSPERSL